MGWLKSFTLAGILSFTNVANQTQAAITNFYTPYADFKVETDKNTRASFETDSLGLDKIILTGEELNGRQKGKAVVEVMGKTNNPQIPINISAEKLDKLTIKEANSNESLITAWINSSSGFKHLNIKDNKKSLGKIAMYGLDFSGEIDSVDAPIVPGYIAEGNPLPVGIYGDSIKSLKLTDLNIGETNKTVRISSYVKKGTVSLQGSPSHITPQTLDWNYGVPKQKIKNMKDGTIRAKYILIGPRF